MIRTPVGGGIRGGLYHSQSPESLFIHQAGLKVVCPSSPYDAKGLLLASIRDPDPVLFFEPKRVYRAAKGDVPDGEYTVPLGKAAVVREGRDVTVLAWGAMLYEAVAAADEARTQGVDAEIVDLNHDGIPEIRVLDDFLAYRFSSFAYSAKAEVVLKYTAGNYSVAPELMKRAAPSWGALNAKIPGWRRILREHSDPEWPPPSLIQTMTDLVFTGNENVAYDLVERVWPPDLAGKAGFLSSYRAALATSKYYAEFKKR